MHLVSGLQKHSGKTAIVVFLWSVPTVAYAQRVPVWLVAAVLSPLLVISFAIILGLVTRSLRIGLIHAGLVLGWIIIFAFVSNVFTNDYVIWTPLVAYAVHALVMLVLIIVNTVKRIRGRNNHEIH